MTDYSISEPKFDFDKNDFVISGGKFIMISGKDLLQQKIHKILRTELNKFKIYQGTSYGVPLKTMIIGKTLPSSYVKSELERVISNAVMTLNGVNSVSTFSVLQTGKMLTISFTVESDFGSINEEVPVYG